MSKSIWLGLLVVMGVSIVPIFGAISPVDIEKAYAGSYKAERAGKFADALQALAPVAKEYPAGYTVNLRMGYLHFLSKEYSQAIENYDKASVAAPSALDAKLGKMMVLMTQGKYAEAEIAGYSVLNIDYLNYLANLRLVYVLRMQQKFALAEKISVKMLACYPVDSAFLAEYGILKYISGNLEQSRKVFSDILVLDPTNALAKDYVKLIDKLANAPAADKKPVDLRAAK